MVLAGASVADGGVCCMRRVLCCWLVLVLAGASVG